MQLPEGINAELFSGLLSGLLGTDQATQKAKLEQAAKAANDVTGLVRTKKKAPAPAAAPASSSAAAPVENGKRKLDTEDDGMGGKRAKTEEMQ